MILINGEAVDPALVQDAFNRIKAAAEAGSEISCCERDDEFSQQAEKEVIDGILLAQEAERRIPSPDKSDVREELEKTLREWRDHGASWDLLEAQRDQLRDEVVARLRMDRFVDGITSSLPPVNDTQLHAYYESHRATFLKPARAKVLHVVLFPNNTDPDSAYRRLLELRQQTLDGADFRELAGALTEKPDRVVDLGWIEHERVLNTFESMLFSLREKEISPVFFYEQSLHLVFPEQVEPQHVTPYDEIADEVRELALQDQRREALAQLADQLRESASIERISDAQG